MSLDEVELSKLEEAISAAQKLLATGNVQISHAALGAAEKRAGFLESDGDVNSAEQERREAERVQLLAASYLVRKEFDLTTAEREAFGSFLEKEYFTRDDFDSLDHFYSSAWDRLSGRGKSELSNRVWNGIRENEYEFTDLPKNVKEKEMERLFGMLSDPAKMPAELQRIPDQDREAFQQAYESGDQERAAGLLNRETFTDNVSVSRSVHDETVTQARTEDDKAAIQDYSDVVEGEPKDPTQVSSAAVQDELSTLNL